MAAATALTSVTTPPIAYNCLTQDAQGAFNGSSVFNVNIVHNEISRNGLGEYPDAEGPGEAPSRAAAPAAVSFSTP